MVGVLVQVDAAGRAEPAAILSAEDVRVMSREDQMKNRLEQVDGFGVRRDSNVERFLENSWERTGVAQRRHGWTMSARIVTSSRSRPTWANASPSRTRVSMVARPS